MLSYKLAVLCLSASVLIATNALGAVFDKRAAAFFDPVLGGGSMFIDAGNGLGEPLNVIISGLSSPDVLTLDGVTNFARAIGFSQECLDIHLGNPFSANLGDGHGAVNQSVELRQDFGDPALGTCLESLIGGNHFRVFFQNGPTADSGAVFLAVSKEEDLEENHTIVPDGYDIGRNLLVESALGTTSFSGVTYSTTAQNITGLMPAGSAGVNHGIAVDGIVTLLTVNIV
ncbi:hypothetical protein BD309DRAFT_869059 [Dichomitus squalens]|uniref:Uncharacterized protein n=1 Tax=Dichomitus squalens TaxID=114155 RepID=A0A4Q9Q2W3_9APHY|nr:uncharacterized protein DICSQDRAFT_124697 [Dichomitus squalens LYAD-421 SS1]EJF65578.1 hypothetical protein DICSQDRAFT_124697 [Dichomitus squalens LYAD-421 SS1]TBU41043.1 hypothetical protein BD309DRAFT_869059 [Dichomitus squalens]TBU61572.1 hypothetical protein BD310DRAFT_920291 [Dichomitus squalens]